MTDGPGQKPSTSTTSAAGSESADAAASGARRLESEGQQHNKPESAGTDQAAAGEEGLSLYWATKFGVHKSLRYLAKRRSFFDFLHSGSKALTAIFGGAAFFSLVGDRTSPTALYATFALAFVSGIDVAFGFAERARKMDGQYRRYAALAAEMETAKTALLAQKRIDEFAAKRLMIEKDDPTPLDALNVICHNQEAVARGYGLDQIYRIGWLQGIVAQVLTFPGFDPKPSPSEGRSCLSADPG